MNGNWGISGSCLFTDLSNAALPQFVSGNDDRSGAGSGNTLPPACCLCVGISAGVGKTKHGRMYIPGIGVADVDGGGIGAALAGDAVDAFTAYVGAVATSPGVLPAIYSRKDGVARSLLTASVDDVLDTQRRRQQRIHS